MDSLNRRVNSYQQTTISKIIRTIVEGIATIGEGMEKQHDEDLLEKKKMPKKAH